MKYTLIMANGKVMCFYIKAMAEVYQQINGGVIVTDAIVNEQKEMA